MGPTDQQYKHEPEHPTLVGRLVAFHITLMRAFRKSGRSLLFLLLYGVFVLVLSKAAHESFHVVQAVREGGQELRIRITPTLDQDVCPNSRFACLEYDVAEDRAGASYFWWDEGAAIMIESLAVLEGFIAIAWWNPERTRKATT